MNYKVLFQTLYPDIKDSEWSLQDDMNGKGHYIKFWLYKGSPAPDLSLYQSKSDCCAQIGEKQTEIEKLKKELSALDWYSIREISTKGTDFEQPVPEEIKTQMQDLRVQIDVLEKEVKDLKAQIC